MTVKAPLGLVVNWPPMVLVPSDPGGPPEDRQKENRDRALRQIAQAFDDAQSYRAARTAQSPRDLRWEAMQPVLEGTAPLFVVAEEVHQIEAAVAFAAQRHMKLVLYGGYDAPQVAALLKEHDVAVIVPSTQRLPRRRSDPYDAAFTLPAALSRAGIRFCIGATGRSWESRNLPYQAATAQAFGLSAEEALRAITLSTAQILGTADRVGALAPGRDATLFVSDGDILDEPTHVEQAFVEGRRVDLTDKQKVLNDKYREKYRRLGIATKP
jgi:imidazolonepropionase-like amidohydrolase